MQHRQGGRYKGTFISPQCPAFVAVNLRERCSQGCACVRRSIQVQEEQGELMLSPLALPVTICVWVIGQRHSHTLESKGRAAVVGGIMQIRTTHRGYSQFISVQQSNLDFQCPLCPLPRCVGPRVCSDASQPTDTCPKRLALGALCYKETRW